MFFPPPQQQSGPLMIDPVKGIRISQIICIAMIISTLLFLCITLIIRGGQASPMIAYLAAAFAALNIGMRFVVPGIMVRSQLKNLPSGTPEDMDARLYPIYQVRMIVGMALLEGAAVFNVIAYLIERQLWTLGTIGLLLVLMAMMFPTLIQFENWAEDVKRDLASQF